MLRLWNKLRVGIARAVVHYRAWRTHRAMVRLAKDVSKYYAEAFEAAMCDDRRLWKELYHHAAELQETYCRALYRMALRLAPEDADKSMELLAGATRSKRLARNYDPTTMSVRAYMKQEKEKYERDHPDTRPAGVTDVTAD